MCSSSRWRIMTLAELWSMRSISIRLEVVMMTAAPGCSLIVSGRLPMWSRWQWVMMIRSRAFPLSGPRSGAALRPTFFGWSPESTRMFRSPSWMNSELAPMPPSRFRSMSFIPFRGGLARGHEQVEGRKEHVHLRPGFVDAVEAPLDAGVFAGDVVAVVGELLAGGQARGLAHDLVALDHLAGAVAGFDHPLAPEQRDGLVRGVADRDVVDERVRLVLGKARAAVVVDQLVQASGEAGDFF